MWKAKAMPEEVASDVFDFLCPFHYFALVWNAENNSRNAMMALNTKIAVVH